MKRLEALKGRLKPSNQFIEIIKNAEGVKELRKH